MHMQSAAIATAKKVNITNLEEGKQTRISYGSSEKAATKD